MDCVPVCFVEETIWLLNGGQSKKALYDALTCLSSTWRTTAEREKRLENQLLVLYVWNDQETQTTRFCINQNTQHVSLKEIEAQRVARLTPSNHRSLCGLLAKNVCSVDVHVDPRFDFNETLIDRMILALNRISSLSCITQPSHAVLKHADQLGSQLNFNKFTEIAITEEVMELLRTLVSSKGFCTLILNVAEKSPVDEDSCLAGILDCMERSGTEGTFTFSGRSLQIDEVKRRAKSLKCQFEFLRSTSPAFELRRI